MADPLDVVAVRIARIALAEAFMVFRTAGLWPAHDHDADQRPAIRKSLTPRRECSLTPRRCVAAPSDGHTSA